MAWGAAAATLLVPAATATSAQAAALAPVAKCFVNPKPSQATNIGIYGTGFTPGDDIALEGDGVFDTQPAAMNGTVAFITSGPILPTIDPGYKVITLTATDEATNAQVAATQIRVANFAFATSPSEAKLSSRVRWSFSGFPVGKTLYGHFTRHGRQLGALKFGKTGGPCGTLSTKARFFPVSHAKQGTYGIQIDTSRRYSSRSTPRITSSITTFF